MPKSVSSRNPLAAASRLYAANLGLAGLVLSRFASLPWEAREEARGAALLALWAACQHYDGARGFTFSTFACGCIKNAVLTTADRSRSPSWPCKH